MTQPLNLARRPFLNTRPVVRISAGLWAVGMVLAAINIWLYWVAFFGLEGRLEQADELARQISEEQQRATTARQALRGLDLGAQNQRVVYLNQRISERAFPWSRLFDDLAGVLPDRVRVVSLSPQEVVSRQRPNRRPDQAPVVLPPARVQLEIRAVAEQSEDMLALLDNIFASPLFEDPALPRESRQRDGTTLFALSVRYLPGEVVEAQPHEVVEVLPATVAQAEAAVELESQAPALGPEDEPTAGSLAAAAARDAPPGGPASERPEADAQRPWEGTTR